MKPIVYLAAFRHGDFTLETLVPDEPISVPNGQRDASEMDLELRRPLQGPDSRSGKRSPNRETRSRFGSRSRLGSTPSCGRRAVSACRRRCSAIATTALGASEVNLLELATAYRTIASGVLAQPYVIRQIVRDSGDVVPHDEPLESSCRRVDDGALALIQEGLRGVVRIPTGTAHALDSRAFPIAVMGKTGTTNEFRDALFVGSTYGADGITVAVRIGFDDNRSLGPKETGARVALPVFQELMLRCTRKESWGRRRRFRIRWNNASRATCRATFPRRSLSTRCWSALRPPRVFSDLKSSRVRSKGDRRPLILDLLSGVDLSRTRAGLEPAPTDS